MKRKYQNYLVDFIVAKNVGDVEGIGIGLYLTREIVSKQGGYIKINHNKSY